MKREEIPWRFLLSRSLLPAVGYHCHDRILPFDYCCEKKNEDESRKEEDDGGVVVYCCCPYYYVSTTLSSLLLSHLQKVIFSSLLLSDHHDDDDEDDEEEEEEAQRCHPCSAVCVSDGRELVMEKKEASGHTVAIYSSVQSTDGSTQHNARNAKRASRVHLRLDERELFSSSSSSTKKKGFWWIDDILPQATAVASVVVVVTVAPSGNTARTMAPSISKVTRQKKKKKTRIWCAKSKTTTATRDAWDAVVWTMRHKSCTVFPPSPGGCRIVE